MLRLTILAAITLTLPCSIASTCHSDELEDAQRNAASNPTSVVARAKLGELYAARDQYEKAIAEFDAAIELAPQHPRLYDARGDVRFQAKDFTGSVADYDQAIRLVPELAHGHWKRGISCFYAKQYDAGRKQFEAYQSYDDSDVENAVWRFLCMVHTHGLEHSRESMLRIADDTRVPMQQIYHLYQGKLQPEDVLTEVEERKLAQRERNAALFYAHLYLGLYYDVIGEPKLAKKHVDQAVQKYPIQHRMFHVARVHAELLTEQPRDTLPTLQTQPCSSKQSEHDRSTQ